MKPISDLYMITGEDQNDATSFIKRLITCLRNGISLLQFRAKSLNERKYTYLAEKILEISNEYNAKLILNCSIDLFNKTNAHGLQLTSSRLYSFTSRPIDDNRILFASCHNQKDFIQSDIINVDFVTLSPVFNTASHPGAQTLGWLRFKELAASSKKPVFALGGVGRNDLITAKNHGAIGIAAINALWNDISCT